MRGAGQGLEEIGAGSIIRIGQHADTQDIKPYNVRSHTGTDTETDTTNCEVHLDKYLSIMNIQGVAKHLVNFGSLYVTHF